MIANKKSGLVKLTNGNPVKRIQSQRILDIIIKNDKYLEKLEKNSKDEIPRIKIFNILIIFVIVFILSSIKAEE